MYQWNSKWNLTPILKCQETFNNPNQTINFYSSFLHRNILQSQWASVYYNCWRFSNVLVESAGGLVCVSIDSRIISVFIRVPLHHRWKNQEHGCYRWCGWTSLASPLWSRNNHHDPLSAPCLPPVPASGAFMGERNKKSATLSFGIAHVGFLSWHRSPLPPSTQHWLPSHPYTWN